MWGLPAIRFVAITSSLDFVHSIHTRKKKSRNLAFSS